MPLAAPAALDSSITGSIIPEVKPSRILAAARSSPKSITFGDLQRLVVAAGFVLDRHHGDHAIYIRNGIPEIINLQPRKGDKRMAKPYQVQQVIEILERYGLEVE
jgi:hypothetical protein